MKSNILVPVSFSERSVMAFDQAYHLAEFAGYDIVLLSVIGKESAETKESAEAKFLELKNKHAGPDSPVHIETKIVEGHNPFKDIMLISEEIKPSFIFMGLGSEIGVGDILGYNVFRLVRESKYPVVTIKSNPKHSLYKTIVLPLDLTEETREKVSKAAEFAAYFKSSIRIVSVLTGKEEPEMKSKLVTYSKQAVSFLKEKKIPCSVKMIENKHIVESIVDYAHEVEADLIMIMSKKELNMKEFFIGTAAQQLINLSDIPVLSVRPKEKAYQIGQY